MGELAVVNASQSRVKFAMSHFVGQKAAADLAKVIPDLSQLKRCGEDDIHDALSRGGFDGNDAAFLLAGVAKMSKALDTPVRPWEEKFRSADESMLAVVMMAKKMLETLNLKLESIKSMEALVGAAALR